MTAEKHNYPGQPVNGYRRLLACDILPLVGGSTVELNARLSLRLLCKAVEFYLAFVQQPPDTQIQNPWEKLFQVIEIIGKKLGWELSNLFSSNWDQEKYCEQLQQYAITHSNNLSDELTVRQLLMSSIVVLIRILNDHTLSMKNESVSYCLVKAFEDPLYNITEQIKKRKRDDPIVLTSDANYSGNGLTLAILLWDILHSNEYMQRETAKIIQQMRLITWINPFSIDLAVYKGLHHEALSRFPQEGSTLSTHLRLASTCYSLQDFKGMLDYIGMIANSLPQVKGKLSNNLVVSAERHLHYLPMAELPVLQYCCRLLLDGIKTKLSMPNDNGDWVIGNALVLMQIDWPQEAHLLAPITERILANEAFRYPLFLNYIVNIDILEELTYLWTEHGGGVSLDIAIGSDSLQGYLLLLFLL